MITVDELQIAHDNFVKNGYTKEQLSFDRNSNYFIGTFFKNECKAFAHFLDLDMTKEIIIAVNSFIEKTQIKYVKFVTNNGKRFIGQEEKIMSWYRGIVGELFIVSMLLPNYSVIYTNDGKANSFKFLYPVPATNIAEVVDEEFGTDCVAVGPNGKPCAIQIKFWNLFTNEKITYGDVISHLYADAVCNEYIGHRDSESMFIIWTGCKDKDISLWINKCPQAKWNMVRYIDRNDMNLTIRKNQNFSIIWRSIWTKYILQG